MRVPHAVYYRSRQVPLGKPQFLDDGEYTLFDLATLIDRAQAFHGFDSAFMWMCA